MVYEYYLDSAIVKPTRDQRLKLQALTLKVCFECKMFDVANWVANINRESGRRGLSHETFSVALQGELKIFSVTGQPPSIVGGHISSPGLVAKSPQHVGRFRSLSERPRHTDLFQWLKHGLGCSFKSRLHQRSWVRLE